MAKENLKVSRYGFDFTSQGELYHDPRVPFKVHIVLQAFKNVFASCAFDSLRLNYEDVHLLFYRHFSGKDGHVYGYCVCITEIIPKGLY